MGQFARPDLGSNCLPRLLVGDTGRERVEVIRVSKFLKFLPYVSSEVLVVL